MLGDPLLAIVLNGEGVSRVVWVSPARVFSSTPSDTVRSFSTSDFGITVSKLLFTPPLDFSGEIAGSPAILPRMGVTVPTNAEYRLLCT